MYQEFFSLTKSPFLIPPDPEFIFFTEQHKEALAHLTYGLQGNGGFVVLTGEVGTGKTTICQYLLKNMPPDTDVSSITQSAVSGITLLVDICNQFSIDYDRNNISLKVMFDALSSWMLKNHQQGRHAIVLIDEAQHLSFDVLEQLRLLTNIEADNQKPLQIILVGQTSLQEKLLTKELRQLSQRITARYHLRTLNQQETIFYIQHRLNIAGAKGAIFDPRAMPAIHKASQGIPLLINQLCDRCLLSAFTQSWLNITPKLVKK
ncbi:ExeA family protein [Psychromonas sp. KJ10-10]|uniref:ExeA family protein n=1 Tax=Psychromonas sp. KJ10-10 TaxID=3391823 RepID=UPI0039B4755D